MRLFFDVYYAAMDLVESVTDRALRWIMWRI